ncbi:MAG: RdgB/HAM1 family non-canonical purine NTP pyrophosphatase [Firmicutes bacterium]|nr:RdgB/HAM1 family non-canonical purine NTP pyrophosphatase [Bacillota bacterium]
MKIVVATNNKGKLKEIKEILGESHEILSLEDIGFFEDIPETEDSFLKNAMLKAKAVSVKTGLPALADDSGLVVNALNGAPGIYSARYAGEPSNSENNNKKLLNAMGNKKNREAHFVASCVLWFPSGTFLHGEGKVFGEILKAPQGEQGFGYDPLFFYPPLNKSFAELSSEEKNSLSHRGTALKTLQEILNIYQKNHRGKA